MLGQIVLEYLSGKDKALKCIKTPGTVSGFAVYTEANELFKKSVLKNFFHFPKQLKIFSKLFFQAAIIIGPRHDIPPKRSPSQAVISAFGMVI